MASVSIIYKSSFLSGQYTGSSSVLIASSLSLLTSSVSNSYAIILVSEGESCIARNSASKSVKEASSMFFETRSGWTECRNSISSSNSLKRSSSSVMTVFWLLLDILDFRKQFTRVFVVTASQAATNICIPSSKGIFGRVFFFSALRIILHTKFLRYCAFSEQITPCPMADSEKLCSVGGKRTWVLDLRMGRAIVNL